MSKDLQAAIEALTNSYSYVKDGGGDTDRIDEVLAALQAAQPVQSIDTVIPTWQERVEFNNRHHPENMGRVVRTFTEREGMLAEIADLHAQRAASDSDWLIKMQRGALDSLYATNAELSNQLAQRAPVADAISGGLSTAQAAAIKKAIDGLTNHCESDPVCASAIKALEKQCWVGK